MTIYNVYRTDNWHSIDSQEFCGSFESMQAAMNRICIAMRKDMGDKNFDKVRPDVIYELGNLYQTQCTNGTDYEYEMEAVELNEWVA